MQQIGQKKHLQFERLEFKYGPRYEGYMQHIAARWVNASNLSYTILKFVPNWRSVVEGVVVKRNDDFAKKVIPSKSVIMQDRNTQGSSLEFRLCYVILGQKIRCKGTSLQ